MPLAINMQRLVERTIELLGGRERFKKVVDSEFLEMTRRWDRDIIIIGRILRSHLYVEYYLSQNIGKANPRLGDLSKSRLTFAQKLSLLDTSDGRLSELVPGIRRINVVRNRLAHELEGIITTEDSQVFMAIPMFNAMRIEGAKPGVPSAEPIDILERFAQHAAYMLSHEFSEFAIASSKAIQESASEPDA